MSNAKRLKQLESMKTHCIKGAGISGFTLMVRLEMSENRYITYPAHGALVILEQGTDLSVISAVFHRQYEDGSLGSPVEVRNPVFKYVGG
jgi:hypothetical protein